MRRVFLFLEILFLVAPLSVIAQKQAFDNGLYWELNGGILTISGSGAMEDHSSPWKGKGVVEKVVIETGVTAIGRCCFWEYGRPHHLKSVVIGSSVTSIGEYAFAHCSVLSSVTIPNSVVSIGEHAFAHCSVLSSVTIPNSVVSIGRDAFKYCRSLTSVAIPNSVTSIGTGVFFGCSSLATIHSLPFFVLEGGEREWDRIDLPEEAVYRYIAAHRNEESMRPFAIASDIKTKGGYNRVQVVKNGITNYYIVSKKGRYGMTNTNGNEIVPPELDAIEQCGNGYLRYKLNGFWGVMNYQGKIIIDTDRGYTSIGDYKSFNKRFAYTMSGYKGECDATGRQISKIKVETPQQTVASSSSSSSSSSGSSSASSSSNSGSSNGGTTTVVVEHHHDPVPVQEWHACIGCGGMGTMGCDLCGGSGTKYIGDRLHRCSRCNGRGIIPCNVCYGNKGQYITVYK